MGETTQALAEVRDQNGNALAGQSVTWSSSNLSVAEVSSAGPISGLITARGEGTSVITATAGSASGAAVLQGQQQPAALEKVGGDGQTGVVGQALPVQPEVLLTDAMGSPVPNRVIQFSVTGGGGSVEGGSSTGQDGRASARWTLGVLLGSHRMRAAFAQFSVEFSATGVAGPAVSITKIAGDGQAGVVLTTLAFPLVVKLVDALGNPSVGCDRGVFSERRISEPGDLRHRRRWAREYVPHVSSHRGAGHRHGLRPRPGPERDVYRHGTRWRSGGPPEGIG